MRYKVIEILKTFSEKETKQFAAFLLSPFFNESQKLKKLYDALLKYYPDFDPDVMSEEELSFNINPNLPYNKSTIKTLFFELANAAEEFLRITNFRSKPIGADDYLREEFFKRKLFKLVDQNTEKVMKNLDSQKDYTYEYFSNRFKVLTDMCNSYKINKQNCNADILSGESVLLCERAKYLTYLFTNELLIQYNIFLTFQKTFKITEETNFIFKLYKKIDFVELLEFLISETDDVSCSLIFELQLANYRAFSDFENETNYHEYKKLFVNNIHLLNKEDIHSNFIKLIRYCIMKPSGKTGFDFQKELFSIYKYILSKKYYEVGVHDYIPIELYRIVLKLGLEMKKFKWTLNFIKEFNPRLNPDRRKNMYNYSLAEYYFHKKRFDEAMRYFHKIELNHFMLRVDLKNLMLMTYYELDLFENAISLIDSYKHFLSNTEMLSDTEIRKCKNFILTVQNMIKYKTSAKHTSKFIIRKNLANDMHNKIWANEKFLMLHNRFKKSA